MIAVNKLAVPSVAELAALAPEIALCGAILAELVAPFFVSRKRSNVLAGAVAIGGLVVALACVLLAGTGPSTIGTHYSGAFVVDRFAIYFKSILLLFVLGIVTLWFGTTARTMHDGDGPEFFTLLLGATLGLSLMSQADDLLSISLCVELASLPSYVLAGFRKTNRLGSEAALKYVLFGAACSSFMIYGLSFVYGICGTLQIGPIMEQVRSVPASGFSPLLVVAFIALLAGIGFKIASVPFHTWCPDVFEGASVEVTAFLSVASKGAGLVLLFRILDALAAASGRIPGLVTIVIAVLAVLTMSIGNLAALAQVNLKRLLAYSSIAHAGYMLAALVLAGSLAGSQALLMYLTIYALMNLGAFAAVAAVGGQRGLDYSIKSLEGLGTRNPFLSMSLTACLLSLIGLPPLAGFAVKLNLMRVLAGQGVAVEAVTASAGRIGWILVASIAINTVLSLYYYARVIAAIYLKPANVERSAVSAVASGVSIACAALLVIAFVGWGWIDRVTTRFAVLHHFNPRALVSPD